MKIMREDLASAVVEAHRLAASGCLWPGWDISGTPLVLHSPEVAYTVGHPSPPEGYEEMEPVAGRDARRTSADGDGGQHRAHYCRDGVRLDDVLVRAGCCRMIDTVPE